MEGEKNGWKPRLYGCRGCRDCRVSKSNAGRKTPPTPPPASRKCLLPDPCASWTADRAESLAARLVLVAWRKRLLSPLISCVSRPPPKSICLFVVIVPVLVSSSSRVSGALTRISPVPVQRPSRITFDRSPPAGARAGAGTKGIGVPGDSLRTPHLAGPLWG